jgi:hypothetical protein
MFGVKQLSGEFHLRLRVLTGFCAVVRDVAHNVVVKRSTPRDRHPNHSLRSMQGDAGSFAVSL